MKLFRSIFQFLIISFGVIVICNAQNQPARDPWVFRSVLDNVPRALTIAMYKNLWISYNTETCTLVKMWKGGVSFRGEVYTSEKIFQPTIAGSAFYEKSPFETDWLIKTKNSISTVKCKFISYRISGNRVFLKHKLIADSLHHVVIEEEPQLCNDTKGQKGLKRTFRVIENKSGVQLAIKFRLINMSRENSYQINSPFTVQEKTEIIGESQNTTFSIKGIAEIRNEGETVLINYLNEI